MKDAENLIIIKIFQTTYHCPAGTTKHETLAKLDTTFIQIVHPVCRGLDVHKKKKSTCLITTDEQGK